jgi:hypothetical protein
MRYIPRNKVHVTAFIGLLLALTAVPALVSAATTGTIISSDISPVISMLTSNSTVNLNTIPTSSGVQTIASDTVTVSTNDNAGYTLKLGETGASSNMVSGGNSIPAVSGSQASPVAQTANTWGYRVDGVGGFGGGPTNAVANQAISSAKFAPVAATASPDTLATTNSTATSAVTTVWYGVAINTSQPNGTYSNGVTYTATAN